MGARAYSAAGEMTHLQDEVGAVAIKLVIASRCRPLMRDEAFEGVVSKGDVAPVRAADSVEPHLVLSRAEGADEIPSNGVGRLRLAAS